MSVPHRIGNIFHILSIVRVSSVRQDRANPFIIWLYNTWPGFTKNKSTTDIERSSHFLGY